MDQSITRERWLNLGLQEDEVPAFEAGGLHTIQAAESRVIGISKHRIGYHLLGTAAPLRQ